jgi:hypothetical protein
VHITIFLMVLQLLPWKESAHDVDYPPGFELVAMVTDDHAQSSTIMSLSALVGGSSTAEKSPLSTDHIYSDMTCILECVEDELHFSAKVSLAEYLESFVEEEVRKSFNSLEDDKLNEVTWLCFPLYYSNPLRPNVVTILIVVAVCVLSLWSSSLC